MAIFGPLPTVCAQLTSDHRFAAALAYCTEVLKAGSAPRVRLDGLAAGASAKVELTGGAFAIEAAYLARTRPEGFFESHRKYIDVQLVVSGAEIMEVADITRLIVSEAYDPARDFIKYADTGQASILKVGAGDAALFFPEDGHMPSLQLSGPGLVRKTVVKVPVD